MEISIKNMVCPRCILAVEQILIDMEISFKEIRLGTVTLVHPLDQQTMDALEINIQKIGFEIITNPTDNLVKEIKTALIELVNLPLDQTVKLSTYLSAKTGQSYQNLTAQFSEKEKITIERFFIQLKIEKAKELLSYNALSLKEIAGQLNYSSTAHLSKQFKEIAGYTPTEYKSKMIKERHSLDKI